ncbi:unnamed protein product [Bursaphelenchus xylophilus]|uniref:(pine wood nematode) hypothetical protein n=1 Tax=Bursaphelenchus xylophilus TaxID=6326 RepID=A0A1I7SM18_BURXY|nr:unnamed protein product [Bursaphelenchus xylophilus]CAG9129964.1 unnamed protein product [Bursaphelenchus xylophilus]
MSKRYSCSTTRSGRVFARRSVAVRKSEMMALEEKDEDEETNDDSEDEHEQDESCSRIADLEEDFEHGREVVDEENAPSAGEGPSNILKRQKSNKSEDTAPASFSPCCSREILVDVITPDRNEEESVVHILNKTIETITVIQPTPELIRESISHVKHTGNSLQTEKEGGVNYKSVALIDNVEKTIGVQPTIPEKSMDKTEIDKRAGRRAQNVIGSKPSEFPEYVNGETVEANDGIVSNELTEKGIVNDTPLTEDKENAEEIDSPVIPPLNVQRTKRRCSVFPTQLVKKYKLKDIKTNESPIPLDQETGEPQKDASDRIINGEGITVPSGSNENEGSGRVLVRYKGKRCKKNRIFVVTDLHPTLKVSPPTKSCFRRDTPESEGRSKTFRWADSREDQPLCEQKEFVEEGFSHNFRKTTKRQVLYSENI